MSKGKDAKKESKKPSKQKATSKLKPADWYTNSPSQGAEVGKRK